MQPWLYIVLVGAVAIVYALMLPARAREEKAGNQKLKETEAALELYMADMERENDELVQLVSSMKQQAQSNMNTIQEQMTGLGTELLELKNHSHQLEARLLAEEKKVAELAASYEQAVSRSAVQAAQNSAPVPPEADSSEPVLRPVSSIKLRYPRLFELHEQGKSIDSIAKTAGLQRGEVQLILQLAKQEETV
ncbi:hypothetical protein GCM10010912_26450 [Paenibacillus albidus]|uniref:DUF2802 domain-containing protein n=1 Tax=Paenibacillus albidus TaxID=2041023 RepID=A0A917CAF0_9BACL|nr:hypothetical protein [Paenibacillus albidus]GGF80124.1 hypothetical protein GCM10010912_26450 [Paenibacillus albidus]